MSTPEILVGVDGSPGSRAAVLWAAAEAVRRRNELVVLHVYEWRVRGARAQIGGAYADDARRHAREVVEAGVAAARDNAPGVNVRSEIAQGSPGRTLVNDSANANLVVVGSRGRGGFASLLLGSVGQQVATHAKCPVVVVRGRSDVPTSSIVVGVDGSSAAGHALGAALAEAVVRDVGVVAIRAYTPSLPPWGTDVPPHLEDWEERRTAEHRVLLDDIAPWADKYPDVTLECIAAAGGAADALVRHSADAQLVVVGTRGHGSISGTLLGSVGLQLLHHAECPVLIAR